MVAPASGNASVVVPVASVVVVVLATVVVADDVVDVDVESTVVVVVVTTGSATFGEHAVAMASTHVSQTTGLPNPRRAMCALTTTRAFSSGPGPSAVHEIVVCGAHRADGMRANPVGGADPRVRSTSRLGHLSAKNNAAFASTDFVLDLPALSNQVRSEEACRCWGIGPACVAPPDSVVSYS